jgi:parallel beta-helix repeat protein
VLNLTLSVLSGLLPTLACQETSAPDKQVIIDHDNLVISESCTLIPGENAVLDADGNGVVQITGDGITVHFQGIAGALHGAGAETPPEAFEGIGILITGQNVKLSGARVSGYRVGIKAVQANRLELKACDVSGNRRDRLRSTGEAEALEDWLSPHDNDEGQWAARYGAGIYIKGGEFVTVSGCRARELQNGLILERTRAALVSDNDFSFMSGWGIALWRANQNFITRNAVDFCIRGYSHGVYNRGQDSAGILLFEQCSNNVIAENSATHCGDGFFAFAGQEALGERGPEGLDRKRLGNNDNIIARNDFSYAAAHGLELTFSFGNRIFSNRFVGNGICGIWGGYSRETVIAENLFVRNGQAGSASEGGGINIEHGQRNYLIGNEFIENSVGVRFWWDADPQLAKLPWTLANGFASGDNLLVSNRFADAALAVELTHAGPTSMAGNTFSRIEAELKASEDSAPQRLKSIGLTWDEPKFPLFGESTPVGARPEWKGRHQILMGEYAPCDLDEAHLWRLPGGAAEHSYRLVGAGVFGEPNSPSAVKLARRQKQLSVRGKSAGVLPYEVEISYVDNPGAAAIILRASGVLIQAEWKVRFFGWQSDPREDVEAWRAELGENAQLSLRSIDFAFNSGSPADLDLAATSAQREQLAKLPADQFGTLAETQLHFPVGRWRVHCVADDGVRVWIDDKLVIDAWKWQPASAYHADFELKTARQVAIRVEHFELDGAARLSVSIAQAPATR